jgi:hypothetical protein
VSKFSVLPLVGDHLGTLQDDRTQTWRWQDWTTMYGLPIAAAVSCGVFNVQLQGISEIVGGLSILAGFLFGLVVFVFQLRLQVTNDPRVAPHGRLPRLIDQLFANVSYAVLVGLLTTGTAIAASATRTPDPSGNLLAVNRWWSAVLVFLFFHLMLLLAMALRRTRAAYLELRR